MAMVTMDVKDLSVEIFKLIDKKTPLLTAGSREKYNTMTVSWGSLGTLWSVPASTVYVRPQRYSHEFMDSSDYYTLSFFSDEYRKAMEFCGSNSGRTVDKAEKCGLTVAYTEEGAPYFEEAELVLVCKKMYHQDFDPKGFCYERLSGLYANQDYHTMYVGEVVQALKKQ